MPVETNVINPNMNHETLKEALIKGDIDTALKGQSEITRISPNLFEDYIKDGYEFICKMDDIDKSFPNSPDFTKEMCSILDRYLTV